jgi:WD40 repeat protein
VLGDNPAASLISAVLRRGNVLALHSGGILGWNATSGQPLVLPSRIISKTGASLNTIDVSADGSLAIAVPLVQFIDAGNGAVVGHFEVQPFDLQSGKDYPVLIEPYKPGPAVASAMSLPQQTSVEGGRLQLTLTADGKSVAMTIERLRQVVKNGVPGVPTLLSARVHVFDVASGRHLSNFELRTVDQGPVRFVPPGREEIAILMLRRDDPIQNRINIHHAGTGRIVRTLRPPEGQTLSEELLSLSGDGRLIAAGLAGFGVCIFDVRSGQRVLTLPNRHRPIQSVAFSPDGARIATATDDGVVSLWDAADGGHVLTLKESGGGYSTEEFVVAGKAIGNTRSPRLEYSADGTRLLMTTTVTDPRGIRIIRRTWNGSRRN